MHSFDCTIDLEDEKILNIVQTNLKLELETSPSDRVRVSINSDGSKLLINLDADDLVMLRAFTNSIFQMISTTLEIISKVT